MHGFRNFLKGSADHSFQFFEVDLEEFEFEDEQQVHVLGPFGLEETEYLAHAAFTAIAGDGCLKNLG